MSGKNPDTCPICDKYVGFSYDIHMLLQHIEQPEDRTTAKQKNESKKGSSKKK